MEWVERYDGPSSRDDYANSIAMDDQGYVYVTGQINHGGAYTGDFGTIKYEPDGTIAVGWPVFFDGSGSGDRASSIAVDADGNVYVSGDTFTDSDRRDDYATIKYYPDGTVAAGWPQLYNGPGNEYDVPRDMTLDSNANVYVTGVSEGGGSWSGDYATIKYDTNGTLLWLARYDGPNGKWDEANSIAVDADGNVYVTGESAVTSSGPDHVSDYATVKYDSDGNEVCTARYNGPGDGHDCARDVMVDSLGNFYVTGYSPGNGTGDDYATIKYDSDCNELWIARYNGTGNGRDLGNDLTLDGEGNVYVTGDSSNGTDADIVTIKYDMDGNALCVARHDDGYTDQGAYIEINSAGDLFVTGWSQGADTDGDYVTIKYDSTCGELWKVLYDGPASGLDVVTSMAVDDTCVCATGYSAGVGTGYDYATLKYCEESDYTLDLTASYEEGKLNLDYSLGTPKSAYWLNYLYIPTDPPVIQPMWTATIPEIAPPLLIEIAFQFLPMGWVGIWTALYTAEGVQAIDFEWVDTGM